MADAERKLTNGRTRVDFQTDPSRYRHWKLKVDGDVATLLMDVDEKGALFEGYELKLNSYDLGVDIELADAMDRLRFEHPQVRVVLLRSGKPRVFCAGANIRMLAGATHGHKVNFCKFTNETRNGIEDASEHSGVKTICVINGTAAGGGYELALAADHIMLVDDGSSAVSLPELPLLAVLPGTGGLTRITDKRKVRRDHADFFCTTEEGIKGKRAVEWRLVDEVVPASKLDAAVAARAKEFAGESPRHGEAKGIALKPLARERTENGVDYSAVSVEFRRAERLAIITLRGPEMPPPASLDDMLAQGSDFWPLRIARELDDAVLDIRLNEFDTAAIVFKSLGDPALVLACDAFLDAHVDHWLVREIRHCWKRVLKRVDLTSRSLIALIEPGSCFAGTLAELAFAADRSYMLIGNREGDNKEPAAIMLHDVNFGRYPMSNGLSRLASRFLGSAADLGKAEAARGQVLDAQAAAALGLVTFALDDIDWEDEVRIFLQERASFSPDGLTLAFSWGGPDGDNTDIYVQPLAADAPRRLTTSPERERSPAWLPDGQHIGFLRDAGPDRFAVMVVPILGAGERRVAEIRGNPAAPPGIQWSPDGKKIYASEPKSPGQPQQIVEIDLESGARRAPVPPATHGPAAGTPGDDEVSLSPDGKWIAFRRRTASAVGDVFVALASGGDAHAVTYDHTGITGLAWTRDGQSLIVSSQRQSSLARLWRFPLNGQPPVCLTDATLAASYPAISPRDGQIAFASRFLDTNIWRIDLQGSSPPQRLIASNLLDSGPRYSADGERIVFRSNRTGNDEIWTANAAGRSPVRLTSFGGPVTGSPHWSPDGQYVVFDSRPDGSADIFVIPAGGGPSRKLTAEASNETTPSFSADGKFIYFASDRSGAWQLWKQPVSGGEARQITFNGGFAPQESADGQWLYFAKLDTGGLFRIPVAGGGESSVLPSLPSGLWGGWGLAGRNLIYAALPDRKAADASHLKILDLETGKSRTIATLSFPPVQWDGSIGLSPDGRFALVTELERQGSEIHLQPER